MAQLRLDLDSETYQHLLRVALAERWDSPIKVDKRKTLVHNMEEDLNDT
jgi:hypothetical protein